MQTRANKQTCISLFTHKIDIRLLPILLTSLFGPRSLLCSNNSVGSAAVQPYDVVWTAFEDVGEEDDVHTCSVQEEDGCSAGGGREQVGEEGGGERGGGRLLLVGDCSTRVAVAAFAGVPSEGLFVMEALGAAAAHKGGCRDVLGEVEGVRLGGGVGGAVGVGRGDGGGRRGEGKGELV